MLSLLGDAAAAAPPDEPAAEKCAWLRFVRRDDWGVRLASVPSGSQNLTHEDNCTRRGGKAQVKRQRLLGQMQMTMRERACRGKAVAVGLVRKKQRKGGRGEEKGGGEAQSYPSPSEHPPDGYGAVDGPPPSGLGSI